MMTLFASREFLVFILTGGTAALVNVCSRYVYNLWMSFPNAIILAYLTGMCTAYALARMFVFRHSTQSTGRSMVIFSLVNVVAVVQTYVISLFLAEYFLPKMGVEVFVREIAHGIGVAVPVFTSYVGHKYYSFR